MILKLKIFCLQCPHLPCETALFFSVLFGKGDLSSSELRCMFFMHFLFLLLSMLLVCYD